MQISAWLKSWGKSWGRSWGTQYGGTTGKGKSREKTRKKFIIDGEIRYFTPNEAASFLKSYVEDLSKTSQNEAKTQKPEEIPENPKKPEILVEQNDVFVPVFSEIPEIADFVQQAVAIWEARMARIAYLKRIHKEDEEIMVLMGWV